MTTSVLALCVGGGQATAQTTWIAGNGDWNTPSNWSPATVPNAGVEVLIDRPGTITVTHSGGTHSIARLTSQENFVLSGGSLAIAGDSTIGGAFTLSGGTLSMIGTLTVAGPASLSAPGQLLGSGDLVTNGALSITGPFVVDDRRGLDIRGGAQWISGSIGVAGPRTGVRISNAAGSIFEDLSGGTIAGASTSVFRNAGTYRLNVGGPTDITIGFENTASGTIDVARGTLTLLGAGTSIAGKVTVATDQTLEIASVGATFNDIAGEGATGEMVISGTSTFRGSNEFDGRVAIVSTGRSAGIPTATVETRLDVGSLELGGVINGPGTITVAGDVDLRSFVNVDGATIIANGPVRAGGGLLMSLVRGARLDLRGGADLGTGAISFNTLPRTTAGALVNRAGSELRIADMEIGDFNATPAGEFQNYGTLRVSGDSVIHSAFINDPGATINVNFGRLTFTNRQTLISGGLEISRGAQLVLAAPPPDSTGRILTLSNVNGAVDEAFTRGALGSVVVQGGVRMVGTNDLGNRLEIDGGPTEIAGTLFTQHATLEGGTTTITGAWKNAFSMDIEDDAILRVSGVAPLESGSLNMRGGELAGNGNVFVSSSLNIDEGRFPSLITGQSGVHVGGPTTINGNLQVDNGKLIFLRGGGQWFRGTVDLDPFPKTGFDREGGQIQLPSGQLFVAEGTTSMISTRGAADALFQNLGTFRRQGAGTTTIEAPFLNDVGGVVEVRGGTLRLQDAKNFTSPTLRSGTWHVSGTGVLEFIGLLPMVENDATLILDGPNASIRSGQRFATSKLADFLAINDGVLDLRNGAVHEGFASLGNFGTIKLDGGILAPRVLTNAAGGEVVGDGEVRTRPTNNGTIRAAGGTLLLTQGVSGSGGTLQIDPGARMVLGGTTTNETGRLRLLGNGLDVGSRTLRVAKDYENAGFGVGNAFNPSANVTGHDRISTVGGTTQALIVGGATREGDFTLDFGLVRGGTSKTITYQIANLGTPGASTDLRGAIQNKFGAAGVTDSRLSGTGVIAQNFGPLAGGTTTGPYAITLTGGGARALDNQSIRILNNFADVKDQFIEITGSTTQLAVGNAAPVPPSGVPVDLGRFRVNGPTVSRGFSVTNTSSEPNSERLAIGSVTTTGNFSASGISAALIDPGATRAAGFTVNVNGGVAGVNAGSARVRYESNGQRFDPGFTNVASNVQDIALTATGYALANPNALPGVLSFGTVLRGSTQARFLTISNDYRDGVPVGFQEGLDARFGTVTGPDGGRFTVGGAISNLAAGGVNSGALSVTLDTSVVGSFSASVPVLFASNGDGTSGFGLFELGTQRLGLAAGVIEATVVNPAVGVVTSTSPIVVDARRVGDAPAQKVVAIRNAADPVAETLSARFDGTTGAATTNAASVSGLAAGAEDAVTLRVGIDTSVAGMRAGRATIAFEGDLGSPLPSAAVVVQGKVYQRAAADTLEPLRLDLGVVRAGQKAPQRSVAMSNVAPIAGLNDGLTATLRSAPLAVDVALDPQLGAGGIPAGTTLNRAFTTALRSDRVGAVSESVVLALGSTNRDMPTDPLGERVFEVFGRVNDVAAPLMDKVAGDGSFLDSRPGLRIELGDVELGRASQIVLSLRNAIEFGDDLVGSFDLAGLGAAVEASGFDPVRLEAGALVDDLVLTFSGRSLGSYAGFFTFDWASVYPGLADLPGSALRVDLFANVINVAPPADVSAPGTAALLLAATGLLARARRRR